MGCGVSTSAAGDAAVKVSEVVTQLAQAGAATTVHVLGVVETIFGQATVPNCSIDHSHDPLLATVQSWFSEKVLGPDGTVTIGGVVLRQRDLDVVAEKLFCQINSANESSSFMSNVEAHLKTVENLWDDFKSKKQGISSESLEAASDYATMLVYAGVAKLVGNSNKENEIGDSLVQYSAVDPGWLKPLLEKLKHPGQTAYRAHKALGDYVYPLQAKPSRTATQPLRIALISDWATGQEQAKDMVRKINKMDPDMLIHLGDVYYSGTYLEEHQYFYKVCTEALPGVPLYNLAGNHDYYAGGDGYLAVIDELRTAGISRQESSFFCLEGDSWVIIAMDTAFHDSSPLGTFTGANLTKLVDSEVEWQRDKIDKAKAAGKKILALSHHQWCTLCCVTGKRDGKPQACNLNLKEQIGDLVPDFAAWFWGHEHSLQLFEPYAGLQRGRLIGHGSTPIMLSAEPYKIATDLVPPPGEAALPTALPVQMGEADFGYYHNNGFAIMTLDGPAAKVEYYEIPWLYADLLLGNKWGEPKLIYTESF